MKSFSKTLMVGAAILAMSASANAQTTATDTTNSVQMNSQTTATTETPATNSVTTATTRMNQLEDESRVVITGTVASIDGDEFELNYGGDKTITVELDRFGFGGDETEYLTVGESVTVSGFIDDDLFEGREIEALDVRLNDSYVYYYYDSPAMAGNNYTRRTQSNDSTENMADLNDGSYFSMTGTVTAIDGDMAMVRGSNNRMIKVDLSELGYNAFDDEGMQKIEVGDQVYTYGEIDDGFFTDKKLVADSIVELRQRRTTGASATGVQGSVTTKTNSTNSTM